MALKSLIVLVSWLCLAGPACGKDEPAPEVEEAPVEPTPGDEADVSVEDVAAPEADADEARPRRSPRDRLSNRRPPPRRGEPDVTATDHDDVSGEDAAATGDTLAGPDSGPETKAPEPARVIPDPPEPAVPVVHVKASSLDASRLMPLSQVIEVTKAGDLTDAGTLPGIATGTGYASILYKGAKPDSFGVSLQAWQDPARRESDDRFRRMRLQYPNAEDVQVLSPAKSFFAHYAGIQMLTFVDSVKRVVATVACGEGLCTHDQLTQLAKAVRERL